MKRKIIISALAAAMLVGMACQAPKTRSVIINSDPQGATILVNGEIIGQTPMKRDIKFKNAKKDRYLIQIRKEGYKTQERYFYYRDDENILFQLEKL